MSDEHPNPSSTPETQPTDAEMIEQARLWPRENFGEGRWFHAMADRMEMMRAALQAITEGRGAYSRDNYQFAINVIESNKKIATKALENRYEYR